MTVAVFISSQRAEYHVPVTMPCRVFGISESWYDKGRDRPPTSRQARAADLEAIWASFEEGYAEAPCRHPSTRIGTGQGTVSDLDSGFCISLEVSGFTCSSPRVWLDLIEAGWKISKNTVAQIMAAHGWAGRTPLRRRSLIRQGKWAAVSDLVGRWFTVAHPDRLWCGGVTFDTDKGYRYLATVLKLCSRRLLGYAFSNARGAALTTAAVQMAVVPRTGESRRDSRGVVFHSDRGSEYTAATFDTACTYLGVVQSMGRVGSALDNAAAKAVNSTKGWAGVPPPLPRAHRGLRWCQCLDRELLYDARRQHSAISGLSSIDYEHLIAAVPPVEDLAA